MSRKRFAFVAVLMLAALGVSAAGVLWSLRQVPAFYVQVSQEQADPVVRKAEAKKMVQRALRLVDDIRHAQAWFEEFTQVQVNSWLAEELHTRYADLVPEGVTDPRVHFREDRLEVGFRFQHEDWNGVVSLRLRPWVPRRNKIALEIESVRAGLLPIPLQEVLGEVSRRLIRQGWRIAWRESHGNDVLVVCWESVAPNTPALEQVQLRDGALSVSGRRLPRAGSVSDRSKKSRIRAARAADQSDARRKLH